MSIRTTTALLFAILWAAPRAQAQSTLYRPANLGGTWVPDGDVVQFNFVHRFYVAPADGSHKVTNFPAFTLAMGLGRDAALGTHYSTNSLLVSNPYRPNETEVYVRWRPVGAERRPGWTVSLEPAYNFAAHSADAELSADYLAGRVTLSGALRGMSQAFGRDTARAGAGAGAVVRLTDYAALAGDAGWVFAAGTRTAWSVALNLVIPGSPHTFSLQASNATSGTIQGMSVGSTHVLYGFEFTIPLHLARFALWFHRTAAPGSVGTPAEGPLGAEVELAAYKFERDSVTIRAGQVVRWTNGDPVAHTVTFDGGIPGSPVIPPQATYSRRFDTPGVYRYHCTPHPYMHGVVIVR